MHYRCLSLFVRSLHNQLHMLRLRSIAPQLRYTAVSLAPSRAYRTARHCLSGGPTPEEGSKRSREIWTIPNGLCMARIAVSPYLGYLVLAGDYKTAFVGCGIAGAMDFLDGYIARNYNQKSVLGSFLDPFADKVLITTMVVTLGMQSLIPTPLASVIVVRDVLLVAGGFAYRALTKPPGDRFFETTTTGSFEVKPEMISKINTVGQLSLIGFTLTNAAYQIPAAPFIEVLGYGVAVTTVWSGVRYIFIGKAFQNLSKDDKDIWSNTKDKLNKKL